MATKDLNLHDNHKKLFFFNQNPSKTLKTQPRALFAPLPPRSLSYEKGPGLEGLINFAFLNGAWISF